MLCENGCSRKVHKRDLCRVCYDLDTGRQQGFRPSTRRPSKVVYTYRRDMKLAEWAWVCQYLGISGGSDRVRRF